MVIILNKSILSILVYYLLYRQTLQYFHAPQYFHTPVSWLSLLQIKIFKKSDWAKKSVKH